MFKGIQKVSLIDYPGIICTTLFTGGCNFRCSWCHNLQLVDASILKGLPDIQEDQIKTYLAKRKGKIQGICVSGGEPTLWGGKLAGFMHWAKGNGFLVKLDTNGYNPGVLQNYIGQNLLDFIAMDIKNTFDKYRITTDIESLDISLIKKSIDIIKKSDVRHQFRTTLVPGMVLKNEMIKFSRLLGEEIVFQDYRKNDNNFQ